jgi:predicted GTPase
MHDREGSSRASAREKDEMVALLDQLLEASSTSISRHRMSETSTYLLWVNEDRTVLVRWWPDNSMEVATRPESARDLGSAAEARDGGAAMTGLTLLPTKKQSRESLDVTPLNARVMLAGTPKAGKSTLAASWAPDSTLIIDTQHGTDLLDGDHFVKHVSNWTEFASTVDALTRRARVQDGRDRHDRRRLDVRGPASRGSGQVAGDGDGRLRAFGQAG